MPELPQAGDQRTPHALLPHGDARREGLDVVEGLGEKLEQRVHLGFSLHFQ